MEPLNYSIDVKSPFEQSLQGLQAGLTLNGLALKQQDQERQRQQQIQMQMDLGRLASNPNPSARDYARVMTLYPQLSEHLKKGFDILQPEQQQAKVAVATQAYAALNAGRNDVASALLMDQAQALRNGGQEDAAKSVETMAKLIELNPAAAKTTGGLWLSSVLGADKFASTFPALGKESRDAELAPSKLTEAQQAARKAKSDADIAEIKARYGEQSEVADLAKKGWDIKKIEADIGLGKENARIAAMNAATNRMNAGTNAGELGVKQKELGLKIQKAVDDRDTKLREKVSEVTSARTSIDNMLNTADQVLKHPALKQLIPATGPMMSRLPTARQETADFEALVENLGAQAFIAQIPAMKGMGALSDAEGKKLAAALQNFSLTQSAEQLTSNVKEAQRLILKARQNLVTKYGIPDTVPDTPAAAPTSKEIDALLKKYGAK